MSKYILTFAIFLFQNSHAQTNINGGFEQVSTLTKVPTGWALSSNQPQGKAYSVKVDSIDKLQGKYSVSIEKVGIGSTAGFASFIIPQRYSGKEIELRGFMKTQKIENGFAGLWLRLDSRDKMVSFDNMQKMNIRGTTDWKEYRITLPYTNEISSVTFGGILVGDGKLWIDSLELYIDGQSITKIKSIPIKKAESDTSFLRGSGISKIPLTRQQINNLYIAGQYWGFLKYHHEQVTVGNYNWDAELFRFLPRVIGAKNNKELSFVLERFLDQLGTPQRCKNCEVVIHSKEVLKPNYGELLTGKILGSSLTKKLIFLRDNPNIVENYWIGIEPAGHPKFTNERTYANMAYPDAGYRLLSLYRYWSMINYYFPYRDVIGSDWNSVLKEFIPQFFNANDEKEYLKTTLKLIAKVNDTHANIYSWTPSFMSIRGKFAAPFQAKFIEGKLVVTDHYLDTLNVKEDFKLGDIITAIGGKKISDLIKMYLPLSPASNFDTKLRDLPRDFLLRSNDSTLIFNIVRNKKKITLNAPLVEFKYVFKDISYQKPKGHYLISKDIAYLYPGRYKNADLPAIKKEFENTKGMIIDMRCYPSDYMFFTFASYLKPIKSPFAKISSFNYLQPGAFSYAEDQENGGQMTDTYKGKVVIIVNSVTQSQAEYTTMAFQGLPNVTVIGSQTAGADGNVSSIVLPGGISTAISGIGIFYPDKTPTQRVGIKIDYVIKPTIAGVKQHKDELLEKAIGIINSKH